MVIGRATVGAGLTRGVSAGGRAYVRLIATIAPFVAAVGLGFAASRASAVVLFALGGLIGTALLFTVPLIAWPGLVVMALVSEPSVLFLNREGILPSPGPLFGGQGRVLAALAVVLYLRTATSRGDGRLPADARKLLLWFGALLTVQVVSAALAGRTGDALGDLPREISYVLAFPIGRYAAAQFATTRGRAPIYFTLAGAATLAACASVAYWLYVRDGVALPVVERTMSLAAAWSPYEPGRSIFPFLDDSPNLGATAFVSLAAFVAPALYLSSSRRGQLVGVAVAAAAFAAVMSTGSRSGLVAAFAAAAAFGVLAFRMGRRRTATAVAIIVILGGSAAATFAPRATQISTTTGTLVAREQIWREAMKTVAAKPVVGFGFHYSARSVFVESATSGGASASKLSSIHNGYLAQLVDGGVVGFVFFAAILVLVCRTGADLRRNEASAAEGTALLTYLAGLTIAMAAGATLDSAVNAIIFWLVLGLAAGTSQRLQG